MKTVSILSSLVISIVLSQPVSARDAAAVAKPFVSELITTWDRDALWYHRHFTTLPANARRTFLNFEAVDYRCEALVNGKSVGTHQGVSVKMDHHTLWSPESPHLYDLNISCIGELGGHGYPLQGHLWDPDRRNWGYGKLTKTQAEYRERYEKSLSKLNELRQQGIAAGIYTQTTDVEGEVNGLMTYDRKVIKIPADELAQLHQPLFQPTD